MTNLQPTSYSIMKTEESMSSKIKNKTRMTTLFIQHSIGSIGIKHSSQTRKKEIQIGKGEVKLSLFEDDTIHRKS